MLEYENFKVVCKDGEVAVVFAFNDGKEDEGKFAGAIMREGEALNIVVPPIMERVEFSKEANMFIIEFFSNTKQRQSRFVTLDGRIANNKTYNHISGFREDLCIVKKDGLENFITPDLNEVGKWKYIYLTYPDANGIITGVRFDAEIKGNRMVEMRWHLKARVLEELCDVYREGTEA
jgi:hypothetical protein